MGLTNRSVGKGAVKNGISLEERGKRKVVALAGNPNVGKSTVFNALTGLRQHTGNWAGKTVSSAIGENKRGKGKYLIADIPGTYSLVAHSPEEEVARNFICFGKPDVTVVVCDATCLERNLNLVLQICEVNERVLLCINLLDEAERNGISIDIPLLSSRLGIDVVGIVARRKKSLDALLDKLDEALKTKDVRAVRKIEYPESIERAASIVEKVIKKSLCGRIDARWAALRLLEGDESIRREIEKLCANENGKYKIDEDDELADALSLADECLREAGLWGEMLSEAMASAFVRESEKVCDGVVKRSFSEYGGRDKRIDRLLTGRFSAYPIMIAFLLCVFWITVSGANYISEILSTFLFDIQELLGRAFIYFNAPEWLYGVFVLGIYRVLAWVISVMLPPMAIFFPLFAILEDAGFLPRIAYDLDKPFCKCSACGKQALTMCMGFGCNAAGVVGCRIIDSERERLLAILTNCFVPCNGKFPMLISLISVFFVASAGGVLSSFCCALILTAIIILGILLTFFCTWLLSKTLLRGMPSSFTLELPPYRRPQITKVLIRSLLDRSIFVLGRAAAVAIPAGCIIWIMANVTAGDVSLLNYCAKLLDPFASFFGLDGVILMAFILGIPANEIVVPIMIMAYTAGATISEASSLTQMREIFICNGWNFITAGSVIIFTLCHWPCSTTLMTIKKESGGFKWTVVSFLLPTIVGFLLCAIFANFARLFF